MGGQHHLLGQHLGVLIGADALDRVGQTFVDTPQIFEADHGTGRAGVDQLVDTVGPAAVDEVAGARHIGTMEVLITPPGPRLGRDVKNTLDTSAGSVYSIPI